MFKRNDTIYVYLHFFMLIEWNVICACGDDMWTWERVRL
jgi:hypothetical protein